MVRGRASRSRVDRPVISLRRAAVLVAIGLALPLLALPSSARPLRGATVDAVGSARIIPVGHDVNAAQSVPRFALVVASVGAPNANGEVYKFTVSLDQNPPTVGRDGQPVHKQTFALN